MRFILILLVTIFVSLPNSNSYADTIYSWTDKDGVKKFSNISPEGDVEDLEVISGMPLSEAGITVNDENEAGETVEPAEEEYSVDTQEPEIENSTIDLRAIEKQIQPQEIEKDMNDEETAAAEQFNAKVQAEKSRLQEQIDRVDKLAVGRGLSLPRKNTMLKNLQEKLDLLEKSPEEYFGVGDTK